MRFATPPVQFVYCDMGGFVYQDFDEQGIGCLTKPAREPDGLSLGLATAERAGHARAERDREALLEARNTPRLRPFGNILEQARDGGRHREEHIGSPPR